MQIDTLSFQMQHVQINTLESDTLMGADRVESKDESLERQIQLIRAFHLISMQRLFYCIF